MSPSTRTPTRRVPAVDARRAAVLERFGRRPFTRAEALAAGLAPHDLRSDAVQPLVRGVFSATPHPPTFAQRCAGLHRLLPDGSRLAGTTAAVLEGHPVPLSDLLTVSIPQGSRFRCAEAIVLRHDKQQESSQLWLPDVRSSVHTSTAEQILVECAHVLPLVDAVVLADSILVKAKSDARSILAGWLSSPIARVRNIAKLSAIGSESAMESRTRVLLVLAGFPTPAVQPEIEVSGRRRRLDLGWPEFGVAVEYDGTYHFASEQQKHLDLVRHEECRAAGWLVVRVVSVGIYRDPADTIARTATALRSRGCPLRLTERWREYFPQLV